MSQQGPILIVSTGGRPSFASALDETKLFPVVDANWTDAARAVEQLRSRGETASVIGEIRASGRGEAQAVVE